MYITIEGVIGAGKTSLTNMLARKLSAQDFYEIVEENPFLEKFYEDRDKWAFQTEMFFLTSRYQQMLEIDDIVSIKKEKIIADYNIMKNLIFAKETLNEKEYNKFSSIFNILVHNIKEADLIIVIESSFETLKKNIKKRGRSYEELITDEYLTHLIEAYSLYINSLKEKYSEKLLIINGDDYDFVNNEEDYNKIVQRVNNKIGEFSE